MNNHAIHPMLVHFPVALLTIYALLELIQIKKIKETFNLFWVKAMLVIIGAASCVPTILAGGISEEQFKGSNKRPIIGVHENFAIISTCIFGLAALGYLIQVWGKLKPEATIPKKLGRIFSSPVFVVLAILGFIALSITGALGNAITRGPESEPITSFVYHLFF